MERLVLKVKSFVSRRRQKTYLSEKEVERGRGRKVKKINANIAIVNVVEKNKHDNV